MRTILALAILLAPAHADVVTVDASGSGDYVEIADALAATTESDVILIRPGDYAGFEIDGRSAVLLGTLGAAASSPPRVTERVTISNIHVQDRVVLSHLVIQPTVSGSLAGDAGRSLIIRNCAGAVRLQGCRVLSKFAPGAGAVFLEERLRLESSGNVALTDCIVGSPAFWPEGGIADGIALSASRFVLFDSECNGVKSTTCADGGSGLVIRGPSYFFASGSPIRGGDGADYGCYYSGPFHPESEGTDGGDGLVVLVGSSFQNPQDILLRGSPLSGGSGGDSTCYGCEGSNGRTISPGGFPLALLSGPIRSASMRSLIQEGGGLQIDLQGAEGDEAVLVLSQFGEFNQQPSGAGVQLTGSLVQTSPTDRVIPLGTLPSSEWTTRITLPLEPDGFEHETWFAQVVFSDANQELHYGPGVTLTVLDDERVDGTHYFCFAGELEGTSCGLCPCGNVPPAGEWGGCLNAGGSSCRFIRTGTASIADDSLSFSIFGAGVNTTAMLVSGDNRLPTMGSCPVGSGLTLDSMMEGLRCVGGALRRHGLRAVDVNGNSIHPWGFGSPNPPGGILASAGFSVGQTRHFQVFYRDNFQTGCQTALNTSNGVSVTVLP